MLVRLTESTVKGPGGEGRLEKSRVQVIPGQEGASNFVFSAVAVCLGQTLGERGQSPKCPSNSGTIISEASLLGKEKKNVTGTLDTWLFRKE